MRTWFDQPGRKLRRRNARKDKAARLGVRPLELLRPAVRGQTVRYNRKLREGRGFTLAELKEAGINRKEARGVGIVVDHRRRNLSEEGKQLNVERLKAYKTRLIVFPKKAGKPKKGDSTVRVSVAILKKPQMTLYRATIFKPRLHVPIFPFPIPTYTRLPAKLQRRSGLSKPSEPFVYPAPTPGTKASAKYGLQRLVYLGYAPHQANHFNAEGGRGGKQEKVNTTFSVVFAPCSRHSKSGCSMPILGYCMYHMATSMIMIIIFLLNTWWYRYGHQVCVGINKLWSDV